MDVEYKWYLAARFLANSLTAEEKAAWEELLQHDKVFSLEFKKVEAQWHAAEHLPYSQYNEVDSRTDWQFVLEKIRKEKAASSFQTHRASPAWLKYAAVLAVVCVAGIYAWLYMTPTVLVAPAAVTKIEAPAGSKTFVTLPDGSTVWLNAGSRLSFNNAFSSDNRDLQLEGEGFFDVVKSNIPFTVHTPRYDIAVLGTAFNVSAYPDDKESVTTLVRGSLKVIRKTAGGGQEEILLKPNEQFRVSDQTEPDTLQTATTPTAPEEKPKVKSGVDVETETAWKDDWLVMRGESLEELGHRMERLYKINVKFEEESLKNYRYTGRIRQLSLEQVLKALALTSPIAFTVDEQTVVFSENKKIKPKYRQSLQTPGP